MATIKAKITKQRINSLLKGDIVWDTEIAGFCARRQVKAIVYCLKKRFNGKQLWLTIGKHGEPWTPDTARDEAKILLGQIAANIDPSQIRDTLKDRPTVEELCHRFIEEYAKEHKKASSVNLDQMNINNHILPLLGKKYVIDTSLADIDTFKRSVKAGKTARGLIKGKTTGSPVLGGEGAANRCLSLLSTVFNFAIKLGIRMDNPVTHVEKYKERKIERYLSEKEFVALAEAIEQFSKTKSNPYPIAAVKLLIFTGARRNEILTLKWSEVDLAQGIISLTNSKTGPKPIYINAPAREVLSTLPRQKDNPYVICGALKQAHLVNIRKPWLRIRSIATITLWQQDENIDQFVCEYINKNRKYPSIVNGGDKLVH
mgnify:CR=1 FL=1